MSWDATHACLDTDGTLPLAFYDEVNAAGGLVQAGRTYRELRVNNPRSFQFLRKPF